MIPKIIHFCWFGGKSLPLNLKQYIDGWKDKCPDYEFVLWDESKFDVNSHSFTKSAYEQRKFAYVSDYVRAYALYSQGGIYLDTDVELKKNIDIFLDLEAFSGFEKKGAPFTAVWGAKKHHILSKMVLDYYDGRVYKNGHETNTIAISDILIEKFGIDPDVDDIQVGDFLGEKINIFPSETFCLDLRVNYATHHFEGSWVEGRKVPYKKALHRSYYLGKFVDGRFDDVILKEMAKKIYFGDMFKMFGYYCFYKTGLNKLKNKI